MQHQENPNDPWNWKRNFNVAYNLLLVHQRALILPMRERCGKEFFGLPCAFAFMLMCAWAALSRDIFMWVWVGIWLVCLIKRKNEALRLANRGVQIHSQYDGWPADAIKYGRTEKVAKLVVEPVMVGIIGGILLFLYHNAGLPVYGMPYFFLLGLASLPFIEKVKQQMWERRIQGMENARIEQEAMMNELRERNGK